MSQTHAPLPWERQDDESHDAWAAFVAYRDLPPAERSLPRVASEIAGESTEKHRNPSTVRRLLERWSSIHRWQDRCRAYDREIDRRASDKHVSEIVAMRRRHAQQMEALLTIGVAPAVELLKRIKDQSLVLAELSNADLFKMTVAFARVAPAVAESERKARGEPSQPADTVTPAVPADLQVTDEHVAEVWAVLEDLGITPRPPSLDEMREQAESERRVSEDA